MPILKETLAEAALSAGHAAEPLVIDGREYLTLAQAARQEGVYRTIIWKSVQRGTLEGRRVGRLWLVSSDSVEKWRTSRPKSGRPPGSLAKQDGSSGGSRGAPRRC